MDMGYTIDTAAAVGELREAGLDKRAAVAIVALVARSDSRLATKADLEALRLATKADIEALRLATKADLEALRLANKADIELLTAGLESLRRDTQADIELLRVSTEARFDALQKEMKARFESVDRRFSLLQWAIGLIAALQLVMAGRLFGLF